MKTATMRKQEMGQPDIDKEAEEVVIEFSESINGLTAAIEQFNTLLSHYMYNVHGIRSPEKPENTKTHSEH